MANRKFVDNLISARKPECFTCLSKHMEKKVFLKRSSLEWLEIYRCADCGGYELSKEQEAALLDSKAAIKPKPIPAEDS